MDNDNEKILSKKFEDIKIDTKKSVIEVVGSFLLGVLASLAIDYIRNGFPEKMSVIIFRSLRVGIIFSICVFIYNLYKWKECYDKWIDIQEKQKSILKCERSLESSSELRGENIENFMHDFVNNTKYVEAIQVHKYGIIPEGKNIIIPIELKRQYLKKDQRHYLNAITNYYEVDKDIFRKFSLIKDDYDNESIPRKKVLDDIESLMSDISKNITAEHSLIYKILISMSVKINRYIGDDYEIDDDTNQIAATALPEYILNNIKRTGILGGVLYQEGYEYEYTKENELKEDRKYYSLSSDIEDDDVITTIIFDTSLSFENDLTKVISDIMESYDLIRKKYGVGDDCGACEGKCC